MVMYRPCEDKLSNRKNAYVMTAGALILPGEPGMGVGRPFVLQRTYGRRMRMQRVLGGTGYSTDSIEIIFRS
jgi:hypothetical protein